MAPKLPPRVRRLFRLPWRSAARIARDVDDELRFHLAMRAERLVAAGMSREDALAEARRRFGDMEDVRRHAVSISASARARERLRAGVAGLWQDLGFAARQVARARSFAVVAVVTLALGIGANSAIFSVVHHLLLAPLPYADGNRMASLMRTLGDGHIMIAPDADAVRAWRTRARTLETMTVAQSEEYVLGSGASRQRVSGEAAEPGLLRFLGVQPAIGRWFTAEDARPGAPAVAVLGYGVWEREYGASENVLGRVLDVDSVPRTIIGVAPAGLEIPFANDKPPAVWTPLAISAPGQDASGLSNLTVIGKLRRGVDPQDAARELQAIAATLPPKPPYDKAKVSVMRAQDWLGTSYRNAVLLLFAAVGLVLLIACANVANLLLVRAWGRQREFAVRAALGAGRARLARQLFTESLVLASAGGMLGLVVAWGGLHAVLALRPAGLENLDDIGLHPAVVIWTVGVALATGIIFGMGPALFASARTSAEWLRSGTRTAGASAAARRWRGTLVIGEIALSALLLVGAGLLLRSFIAMHHVDLGFDPRGLGAARFGLPQQIPAEQRNAILVEALQRMRASPGITGAEVGEALPEFGVSTADFEVEGRSPSEMPHIGAVAFGFVQPGFFRLARIRLRGRTFSGDTTGRVPPPGNEIILNEALARQLWPDGHALGKRLRLSSRAPWQTVVGIAADVVLPGQRGSRWELQYYEPTQLMFPWMTVAFRTNGSLGAAFSALRRLAVDIHPELELAQTWSSETELDGMMAGPRFAMMLLSAFALAALVLSAVGLYGVISYSVGQRTREIGVRVALGAQPGDIGRLVVGQGTALAAAGLAIGIVAAVIAGRAIRSFLYGIGSTDPLTYVAVALLLGGVTLLASYLPARRAMRVDPIAALAAD